MGEDLRRVDVCDERHKGEAAVIKNLSGDIINQGEKLDHLSLSISKGFTKVYVLSTSVLVALVVNLILALVKNPVTKVLP